MNFQINVEIKNLFQAYDKILKMTQCNNMNEVNVLHNAL